MTLRVVHADLAQFLQRLLALHRFRHHLLAHHMADVGDRTHHLIVDAILYQPAGEQAVDLEIGHAQRLEVGKR